MEGLLFVHGLVNSLGQILRSLDGYYEKKQLGLVSPNLNLEGQCEQIGLLTDLPYQLLWVAMNGLLVVQDVCCHLLLESVVFDQRIVLFHSPENNLKLNQTKSNFFTKIIVFKY